MAEITAALVVRLRLAVTPPQGSFAFGVSLMLKRPLV